MGSSSSPGIGTPGVTDMKSRIAIVPAERMNVAIVANAMIGIRFGKLAVCGASAREKMRASLGVAFELSRASASW